MMVILSLKTIFWLPRIFRQFNCLRHSCRCLLGIGIGMLWPNCCFFASGFLTLTRHFVCYVSSAHVQFVRIWAENVPRNVCNEHIPTENWFRCVCIWWSSEAARVENCVSREMRNWKNNNIFRENVKCENAKFRMPHRNEFACVPCHTFWNSNQSVIVTCRAYSSGTHSTHSTHQHTHSLVCGTCHVCELCVCVCKCPRKPMISGQTNNKVANQYIPSQLIL